MCGETLIKPWHDSPQIARWYSRMTCNTHSYDGISQPPFATVRLVRDLPLKDRAGVGAPFF